MNNLKEWKIMSKWWKCVGAGFVWPRFGINGGLSWSCHEPRGSVKYVDLVLH